MRKKKKNAWIEIIRKRLKLLKIFVPHTSLDKKSIIKKINYNKKKNPFSLIIFYKKLILIKF